MNTYRKNAISAAVLFLIALVFKEWGTLLYVIVYTLGALLFYYLLFASKLIPRWLSGWEFLAVVLLLTGALLYMFGIFGTMPLMKAMVFFGPPIGLQEMVMSVWLIVKGFNPSAIELSLSATLALSGGRTG